MNKKALFGSALLASIIIYAWPRSPKFSVETIDRLKKRIKFVFDGIYWGEVGPGQNDTASSRKGNYVLVSQGDVNGVLFTLYKEDKLIKRLPVLYNSPTLPNKL